MIAWVIRPKTYKATKNANNVFSFKSVLENMVHNINNTNNKTYKKLDWEFVDCYDLHALIRLITSTWRKLITSCSRLLNYKLHINHEV